MLDYILEVNLGNFNKFNKGHSEVLRYSPMGPVTLWKSL